MDEIRLLIIGLTSHHTEHIEALQKNQLVTIIGVCNIDSRQAKNLSSELGEVPYYQDFNEAIDVLQPDALLVSLPHDQYIAVVELALRKNIHILKEKPFARDLSEAQEITKLFKRSHSKMMTISQRRFHKTYIEAKNHIGELGKVNYVFATYCFNKPTSGWRKDKKISGGGVVIDSGYHLIDLLLYYFGLPETVECQLSKLSNDPTCETEDYAQVELNFPDKNSVQLVLNRLAATKKEEVIIYGELGKLAVNKNELQLELFNSGSTQRIVSSSDNFGDAYLQQHKAFFSSLINDDSPNPGIQEGLVGNLIIEACYLSANASSAINIKDLIASRGVVL